MAHAKNSSRSKRKYGDKRMAATAANRASKKARSELRAQRLIGRTQALLGKRVIARTAEGLLEGTVTDIVKAPEGSRRKHGQFLVIQGDNRSVTRSRHRVKIAA